MIEIKLKFPKFDEELRRRKKEIFEVLAATMQTNRAMMFDKDGEDNGKEKWAPLKFRNGRPLQNRGTLRKSFAPMNDGIRPGKSQGTIVKYNLPVVTIGTNLAYAELMNDGTTKMPNGVLKATRAQALKIPLPKGSKATDGAKALRKGAVKDDDGNAFIFRKSVRIPARKMDVVTEMDEREYAEALQNYISEILSNVD